MIKPTQPATQKEIEELEATARATQERLARDAFMDAPYEECLAGATLAYVIQEQKKLLDQLQAWTGDERFGELSKKLARMLR